MRKSTILASDGSPMMSGFPSRAYVGADTGSQELANWLPSINSADKDYLSDRNTIVARSRDLVRNSGWASGAISRHLDSVIGSGFRLSYKPDYKALGLTAEWAAEFADEVEGRWKLYAEDPDCWIDAARQENFNGLLGLAYRHRLIDGESLAVALWIEDKPFDRYATTIQMIDPDRLCNPNGAWDSDTVRGGVELSEYSAPVAYHIRKRHPYDFYGSRESYTWERVERETKWGRKIVLHSYDKERAGQTRGIGLLAPIIERLKMIDKYDRTELQAALLNAIFAAFIESPFDHDMLAESLGDATAVGPYQTQRSEFHKERNITVGGARIPTLFPGEKFNMQAAARPASQFGDFEKACLRNVAAGIGLSYEQLSQDWSSTNYSSARAALLEVWKFHSRSRRKFAEQFASPIFVLWMEEAVNRGDLNLPKNAPDFYTAKAAYTNVRWIGSPRGWIDPVKEAKAAQMRMDMGISTLEDECGEQGKDYQEVLQQRSREIKQMKDLGIPPPSWAQHLAANETETENPNHA